VIACLSWKVVAGDAPTLDRDREEAQMPPKFTPVFVEPYSDELAARCGELLTRDGIYEAPELEDLVRRLAERPDLWEPLIVEDRDHRRYHLLYEDERIDIWVLSWMPGQRTGFHDHDISDVGLVCCRGELDEGLLVIGAGAADPIRMTPGVSRNGPGGYIHSVAHVAGEPAVSIHAYSPPLLVVGQYRQDADGRLLREPEHGRKELLDTTIAVDAVALRPTE
jgi:predicted metal-dependent enzyme (double-stranded beta helix superfamily)